MFRRLGVIMNLKSIIYLLLIAALATPVFAEYQVDPFTTALWHFDEGSGNIAFDETLNSIDGLVDRALWSKEVAPITSTEYALDFSPGDAKVAFSLPATIDHRSITIEAWIFLKDISARTIMRGTHFIFRLNGNGSGGELSLIHI